jgi:hypothetical protein
LQQDKKNYKIYFIVGNEMGTLHIYFFILSNLKDIIYCYIVFEIVEAPTYIFFVLCKKESIYFLQSLQSSKIEKDVQQQHSLLSQASWGRLETKPKRDEKISRHNSNSTFLTCLALM